MQLKLRSRALDLVRSRPAHITLKKIANDTGINHNWLKAFVLNRSPNPGVDTVETLYCYLAGKELEL